MAKGNGRTMENDLNALRIEKESRHGGTPGRRPWGWIAAGAVVLAAAAWFLLSPSRHEVQAVTVSLTYPSQPLTLLSASGYVVADRKASLATKATASLVWIGVEEGSRVKEGDVLAKLENAEVRAVRERAKSDLEAAEYRLPETQAELDDAALNLKRMAELVAKGYVARSEHDSAKARSEKARAVHESARRTVQSRQAGLREAKAQEEYTLIRAPFDAVVLTKNADVGDIISPLGASSNAKAAVVTIADLSSLRVEVDVSESNLFKVREGGPVEVVLDAVPGTRFSARVHRILPTADRTKATVMVKIKLDALDERVLPEMSAKAFFLSRALQPGEFDPHVTVPPSAVVERDGREAVFAIRDGRAVLVPVVLEGTLGEARVVREGVKPGERVVLSPPKGLSDGGRISLLEG